MPMPAGRYCWVCGEASAGFDPTTNGHLCEYHTQESRELMDRVHRMRHRGAGVGPPPYTRPRYSTRAVRRGRAFEAES
jgi:hypothetical protein